MLLLISKVLPRQNSAPRSLLATLGRFGKAILCSSRTLAVRRPCTSMKTTALSLARPSVLLKHWNPPIIPTT